MVICGIDPGSHHTGYGIISAEGNRLKCLEAGVISPKSGQQLPDRLQVIYQALTELFCRYKPGYVSIEEAFYAKNVKTTLVLGHARGVAMLAAVHASASVHEYAPRLIKKNVVGTGSASKEQVEYMVRALLALPANKKYPPDATDALAVALCYFNHQSFTRITKQL